MEIAQDDEVRINKSQTQVVSVVDHAMHSVRKFNACTAL